MTGPLYTKRDRRVRISDNPAPHNWRQIILRDPCPYCLLTPRADFGKDRMTLEHVEPKITGGRNGWENLVGAHAGCNQQRSARPLLHFLLFRCASAGRPKKERRRLREQFFAHQL